MNLIKTVGMRPISMNAEGKNEHSCLCCHRFWRTMYFYIFIMLYCSQKTASKWKQLIMHPLFRNLLQF